jgi:hypothetical protein
VKKTLGGHWMTWRACAAFAPLILLLGANCTTGPRFRDFAPPVVAYENGWWFTGTAFEPRTMYVARGHFVARPARVDSVVDLAGGYVVPPFAEAHNHNVEPSARIESLIRSYLEAGVFYVQNPDNLPRARAALAGLINQPSGLDVTFANGGLTGPGGHPGEIARRNVARGAWASEDGEGAFFLTVSDRSALARAWPALLDTHPDFVKVYLLYSEEYEARLVDPTTVGWRGLDPTLLPDVVRRAHAAGLRVVAHVETASDFHQAVAGGVDQVAHLPGFRGNPAAALPDPSRYQIREEDARLAARQRTVVVTTIAGLARYADEQGDPALRRAADRLNRANLEMLLQHGVPIAIGSDEYGDTSVGEALYLHELGVFSPAALLRIWTETTARTIFPTRRLGRLQPGYEASFLSLAGNPLLDFSVVKQVRLRVKQGQPLEVNQ